jgi:two-component system alkaline phosphatase synthesis response regulator PhoP
MHRASIEDESGQERALNLTPLEFKILFQLARRPDQVFTRDQLLTSVWGTGTHVYDRTVDTHVCSLRKKLGSHASCLESVLNVGYKLCSPEVQPVKKAA